MLVLFLLHVMSILQKRVLNPLHYVQVLIGAWLQQIGHYLQGHKEAKHPTQEQYMNIGVIPIVLHSGPTLARFAVFPLNIQLLIDGHVSGDTRFILNIIGVTFPPNCLFGMDNKVQWTESVFWNDNLKGFTFWIDLDLFGFDKMMAYLSGSTIYQMQLNDDLRGQLSRAASLSGMLTLKRKLHVDELLQIRPGSPAEDRYFLYQWKWVPPVVPLMDAQEKILCELFSQGYDMADRNNAHKTNHGHGIWLRR